MCSAPGIPVQSVVPMGTFWQYCAATSFHGLPPIPEKKSVM